MANFQLKKQMTDKCDSSRDAGLYFQDVVMDNAVVK